MFMVLKLEKTEFREGNNLTAATRNIERDEIVLAISPLIKTEYTKLEVTIITNRNSIKYQGTIE